MVSYQIYLRNGSNRNEFIGALPERRINPERILGKNRDILIVSGPNNGVRSLQPNVDSSDLKYNIPSRH